MSPRVTIFSLHMVMSDHTPLVMDICSGEITVTRPFRFELCWFLRPDLCELVASAWSREYYDLFR